MRSDVATSLLRARTDPHAFADVYDAQAGALLVFFVRRTFDVEVARDLTAETFAQAFEHRHRYRGLSEPEAVGWLYGIARHQLSRYFRKGAAEQKAVRRLGVRLGAVTEDDAQRVIELAGLTELRQRLAAACSDLTEDQRAAVRLRVLDEHSYPAVAAMLGISEDTARARVSRALRRIAKAMEIPTPEGVAP
jgi:RNA polymerase sigma-70 factor (ECF subfamily)